MNELLIVLIVLMLFIGKGQMTYLYGWVLEKLALLFTGGLLLKLIVGR
jgi:uncharacterized protein YybS (DUF2232 family)